MNRFSAFLDRLASRPSTVDHSLATLIVADRVKDWPYRQRRALVVAAVFRARQLVADTVSSVPILTATGEPVPAANGEQDLADFADETMYDLIDHGEAYWLTSPNGDLEVAYYGDMIVEWDEPKRRRLYTYRGRPLRTVGLNPRLIVVAINRARQDLRGSGPMQSERIRGLVAEQLYSQEFFENAAQPTGTLQHPSPLTATESAKLRRQWEEAHAKRHTAVLSGGIEYKPLSFNPNDSQWTESHMVGIGDVANLFGLPGSLLNYNQPGSSLTYQNIGSVFEEFWRTTGRPTYARRIAGALTHHHGLIVKFDPAELFLASMRDRSASATSLVGAGFVPADVLEAVGIAEVPHTGRQPVSLLPEGESTQ